MKWAILLSTSDVKFCTSVATFEAQNGLCMCVYVCVCGGGGGFEILLHFGP